jgi:hypothetical protein
VIRGEVELPYLVQDQLTGTVKGMSPIECFVYDAAAHDDVLLDGPVSRRVAVLDFDERDGSLHSGVAMAPPKGSRKRWTYAAAKDPRDRAFQRVSVFATVLRTMAAFEDADVLGRRLTWAFDGPQLLVVPRAGDFANAFYERESRSLQFFQFHPLDRPSETIYTSLSHDIVAHETGHAILDGIHPDLYHAITPQALAIHEAVADLTALVMSLDSRTLRRSVLDQTRGRIDGLTALSAVAEEFGKALGGGRMFLRSHWNEKTLDPRDSSVDAHQEPNLVDRAEPHDLCQVLTGSLFRVLVSAHEHFKKSPAATAKEMVGAAAARNAEDAEDAEYRRSGKALWIASRLIRRLMFRALDYLPPGDVSFADYGRAMWAADHAANPATPSHRRELAREFVRRAVVGSAAELATGILREPIALDVDLAALLESDWAAYDFANRNRRLLRIPPGVPFRVCPRLATNKVTWREGRQHDLHEIIFKVAWERLEPKSPGIPFERAVRAGTTLVVDRQSGRAHSLITTDAAAVQRADRTRFLRRLMDDDMLDPYGGDGAGSAEGEVTDGVLRVRFAARSLHVARGGA